MNNKHIFIDESGSNNRIFIICLIIFNNRDKILEVENKINKFKINIFKTTDIELHFNKESLNTKRSYLRSFSKEDFKIKYFKSDCYLMFSDQIINAILEYKEITNDSVIFIDGFKSRYHNRKILSKIKGVLKEYGLRVKSIKYIDSKNSSIIQLADMCAGCIRRKFEKNSKEDNELFNLIKPHMR